MARQNTTRRKPTKSRKVQRYEAQKKPLTTSGCSPEEYQRRVKEIAKSLKF